MVPILGGRFQLSDLLAGGDAGMVWRALDRGTGRTVAVKVLHPHLAAEARLADRFLGARRELTALWHPSIARLLEVVVDDDALALVSDLVDGTDLNRWPAMYGPLTAVMVRDIAESIADALASAHRVGMVHGDIKPSNIVIPPPGGGPVRLTDFSVAVLLRAGRRGSGPVTRPWYRAPEVTEGVVPAPSSDVFGLGAVVNQMLAVASGPDLRDSELVAALRDVALSCLVPEPGLRPTADAVCQTLRDSDPGRARPSYPGMPSDPPLPTDPGVPRDSGLPADQRLPAHRGRPADLVGAPRVIPGDRANQSQPRDLLQPAHVADVDFGLSRNAGSSRYPGGSARPFYRRPLGVALGALAVVVCLAMIPVFQAIWGSPSDRSPAQPSGARPGPAQPGDGQAGSTAPGGAAGNPPGSSGTAGPSGAPALPTGPEARSAQGGAEFVRYFFAALTTAVATGDTAEISRLASPACGSCQSAVGRIRSTYDNGGTLEGGAYAIRRVTYSSLWTVERPLYDATVDRTPRSSVARGGASQDRLDPLTFANCVVILEWAGDGWRLLDVPTPGCVA